MTAVDRAIGRMAMYRLVLVSLVFVFVSAIVAALLGGISYSPLELLASAAVALIATIASSWAVARLFRARFHLESAAITGWLIVIILIPTTEPLGLLVIAVAGIVASASKFLLAFRGRHIFNPAALGAFVVTVSGLTFSGWWVATPALLPSVALAAAVVLYRVRRFGIALAFIGVSAAILVVRFVSAGDDPGADALQAVQIAFLSLPTVFFAAFMLTEPLTLPPRRWQTYLVAVIAAAFATIPFSFGPLSSTPQLALLVANVVAFAFGQRRGVVLEFVRAVQLSPATWEVTLQPTRPVRFTPGQYIELNLPHAKPDQRGTRRVFSISNAPVDGGPITVAMRVGPEPSTFKSGLLALAPGSRLRATSVGGDFVLPRDPARPLLLVAGGIGITPFASHLEHAQHSGRPRDVVVVYSVSDPAELAYADRLTAAGARVVVVAPEAPDTLPAGWSFAGPGRLSPEVLRASVPDLADRAAYVSGPPSLVRDARRMLRSLGSRRIATDAFSGY